MCHSLFRAIGKHSGRKSRDEADKRAPDCCAEIEPELGAYLVGSICARDRARLVRHLDSCERCRDELAGLAALPGLLHRVSANPPPDPGPDVPAGPDPA
jgi:anti-sigma factor RsiW